MELSMRVNLASYSLAWAYVALSIITMSKGWTGEAENFVAKLKMHYQKTPPPKVFSITHNYLYLGENGYYRSWDYQAPNRYTAFKVTEFDLENKHYVENVVHHFTGGRKKDELHFQNSTESFRYEKTGIPYGKRVVRQSMDEFEDFRDIILVNIDFFAVTPLLLENNVTANVRLQRDTVSGKTSLIHQTANSKSVEYVFNDKPLRLLSLNNSSNRRRYFYDDYQTTNGLTFARSIVQYTNGDTTPTFIKRIERLEILKEIAPEKLKIPAEFGPVIPKSDRTLITKEIAADLYLVTDSSAWRNSLLKVKGDEIMLFGAAVSPKLAEQTMQLILDKFPNKRISSVYVTHPHNDHIAGLSAYAKRGITIYADAYSIAAIKAYRPFANDISTFKFQTIEHQQTIDDMRFYVLENSHAKRQSFVHFQDSGIIYQADFFDVAFDNTTVKALPSYTKIFIDFVRDKQLKLNRIVGHHYNNDISPRLMDKDYRANANASDSGGRLVVIKH